LSIERNQSSGYILNITTFQKRLASRKCVGDYARQPLAEYKYNLSLIVSHRNFEKNEIIYFEFRMFNFTVMLT